MGPRPTSRAGRPSTGRARNERARRDIFVAALELAESDLDHLTVDRIPAYARVGKQTIYRWWPSKWAVLLDALLDRAEHGVPVPHTSQLAVDGSIELFLASVGAHQAVLRSVVEESAQRELA